MCVYIYEDTSPKWRNEKLKQIQEIIYADNNSNNLRTQWYDFGETDTVNQCWWNELRQSLLGKQNYNK